MVNLLKNYVLCCYLFNGFIQYKFVVLRFHCGILICKYLNEFSHHRHCFVFYIYKTIIFYLSYVDRYIITNNNQKIKFKLLNQSIHIYIWYCVLCVGKLGIFYLLPHNCLFYNKGVKFNCGIIHDFFSSSLCSWSKRNKTFFLHRKTILHIMRKLKAKEIYI